MFTVPGARRKRIRIDGHQTQILRKFFQHNQHPKPDDYITLEVLTGLPYKRILVSEIIQNYFLFFRYLPKQ